MYVSYLIINLFLLRLALCWGSTSPRPFPACNQPLNEIVQVRRGENAKFSSLFYEGNDLTSKYWHANFSLIHPKGNYTICRSNGQGTCMSEIDPHFHITVFKSVSWNVSYRFQLTIIKTNHNDSGIYIIKSSKPFCTILRINIIVDTPPLCSTLLVDGNHGNLELSCRWRLQESGDKIELKAGNQTLQRYQNYETASDTLSTSLFWNDSATVFGTMVAIPDAFDEGRIPDTCLVSNSRLRFEDQCKFSVFMKPKTKEITEFGQEVLFTCCPNSEKVSNIGLYNVSGSDINIEGDFFKVHIDTSRQGCGDSNKSLIFYINGEDTNTHICIGKLVLNLKRFCGVTLFGKMKPGSPASSNEDTCTRSHIIVTISAEPVGLERKQKTVLFTSDIRRSDEVCDLKSWTSLLVVFAISVLLNIASCLRKCSKILICRKRATMHSMKKVQKESSS